jgi:hypothetical protein
MHRHSGFWGGLVLLAWLAAPVHAQSTETGPGLGELLQRIERLEQQNAALRQEVQVLRTEVDSLRGQSPTATVERVEQVEERVAVQEERTRDQAQTKVESSQKYPIRLTGMALFNTFWSGRNSGNSDNPLIAAPNSGERQAGATFRQTVVGLLFDGPQTVLGGKVHGSIYMDLFGGSAQALNNLMRLRTASIEMDWKNRSLLFGLEKPIFSPREPNSLSQVGYSPLSRAGNLWLWRPQVRFEQDFALSARTDLRAQVGVIETSERYAVDEYAAVEEHRRPGLEGRFELTQRLDDRRRIEFAPGFHISNTLVEGTGVRSSLFSLDWFANPWRRLEFSGSFFTGQNVSHFGGPNPGFTVLPDYRVIPVHALGGWAQFTLLATERLSFNIYGGQQDDRNRDLPASGVSRNMGNAVNVMYRIAPNVLVSLEASQLRTTYLLQGTRINNHYDLALAYLF